MRHFPRNNGPVPSPEAGAGTTLESAIAAGLAVGVVVVGADTGKIIYTNECWDRMFGYDRGELLGHHVAVVNAATDVPPEARAREIFGALSRDGAWSGEVHNVRKDGTRFWTSCNVSPLEHDGSGPAWVTVQIDITGRVTADDRLADAEQRYRRLFESSPAALALIDGDLRLELVNQSFADILGYRPHELQGMRLPDLTHPGDVALCAELRQRVLSGETPHYRLEERLVTRQGGVVPVAFSATVVRGRDGSPEAEIAAIEPLRPGG